MVEPMYPKFDYFLDEADPDILILRRQDGAFVARFSVRDMTYEDVEREALEDRLLRASQTFSG